MEKRDMLFPYLIFERWDIRLFFLIFNIQLSLKFLNLLQKIEE